MNTQTTAPVDSFDSHLDALSSIDAKLRILQHAMNFNQDTIGTDELFSFAILLEEARQSLEVVADYCGRSYTVLSPLKRHIKDMQERPDLLEWTFLLDPDGKIQQRFISDLHRAKRNCKSPMPLE